MKDKKYYTDLYEKAMEEAKLDFIDENGSLDDFCYSNAEGHYIETVGEMVGYYIYYYEDEAFDTWWKNIGGERESSKLSEEDKLVTKILKELSKGN